MRVIGPVIGALIGKRSTAAESGATLASLVTGTEFADTTGAYIDRGTIMKSSPLSYDHGNAEDLWLASERLTALVSAG
ncbi:hypothetical protein [Subtercola lobariae]|uniref:Uncharacterized protein n=1 Tax=Subtercola lobariae TaxID=1588641 RepID=A0A917EV41_9MICO|nr:hypothetical protein [Subtercola lobariae]GGF10598.1 hypothetical protein GCM10011399_00560 [Subtercola lobariae]